MPIEKHVAAPPTRIKSPSAESTTLEPTINGLGTSASGRTSRAVASIFDSEVVNTMISSSRLTKPSVPTPPRRTKNPRPWAQAAPNLDRRKTVSLPRTWASVKVMVGFCSVGISTGATLYAFGSGINARRNSV